MQIRQKRLSAADSSAFIRVHPRSVKAVFPGKNPGKLLAGYLPMVHLIWKTTAPQIRTRSVMHVPWCGNRLTLCRHSCWRSRPDQCIGHLFNAGHCSFTLHAVKAGWCPPQNSAVTAADAHGLIRTAPFNALLHASRIWKVIRYMRFWPATVGKTLRYSPPARTLPGAGMMRIPVSFRRLTLLLQPGA